MGQPEETESPQKSDKVIKLLSTTESKVHFSSDEEVGPSGQLAAIQEVNELPMLNKRDEAKQMNFEDALDMIRISKQRKKDKQQTDEVVEEPEYQPEYETITTTSGRTFRSRPKQELDTETGETGEPEEEKEEEIDYAQEIEIGELRGLEEDNRIIIVQPKEESTVEASGEDDYSHDSEGSDGPTSETVQGVKIKFKSKAQIPPTMVEEAEIAALDRLEVVTAPLPPMKPEKSEPLTETEIKLASMPTPPGQPDGGMVEQWEWEEPSTPKLKPIVVSETDSVSIVSSEIQILAAPKRVKPAEPEAPDILEVQKSIGDKLLEAYNEEHFIQEELKDIREMNKQKYLEKKTVMTDERKAQAEQAAKPKRKSVGFADPGESDFNPEKKEPKEQSQYLPENKPKPILKSESTYDESLQGSSFNTPKPQRKAKVEEEITEEVSTEDDDEEDETSEDETETETEISDGSDPYEDDVFAGKGELAGRLPKKKYIQPGIPIHPGTEARVIFKLRDPDPQMVAAWRREFRDCSEVIISYGKTVSEEKWDAICMPMTNSFGWTDVEPEKSFVDAAKVDGGPLQAKIQLEYSGELLVGQSILLSGKKDRHKNCRFVIAAPIMRVPIMISQSVNPYLAMRSAIQTIRHYNMTTRETQRIRTVLFPGLGHGMIGRMPHYRVAHQMRKAYDLFALEKDTDLVQGKEPGNVVTFHVQMNQYKLGHKV